MPSSIQVKTQARFAEPASLLGALCLGASPIFVRFSHLGPLATAFYRMLLALPIIYAVYRLEKKYDPDLKKPLAKDYRMFALSGFFFALDLAFWNASVHYTSIVNSTLFNNFVVFFIPLFSWLFFRERPSYTFMIAVIIALYGSFLLTSESLKIKIEGNFGDFLAIISAVWASAYVLSAKKLRAGFSTAQNMLWISVSGTLSLGMIALLLGESLAPKSAEALGILTLYAVTTHALGQGSLSFAMGVLSARLVALFMLLAPVFAALLGFALFGETLGLIKTFGCLLVIASIALIHLSKEEKVKA